MTIQSFYIFLHPRNWPIILEGKGVTTYQQGPSQCRKGSGGSPSNRRRRSWCGQGWRGTGERAERPACTRIGTFHRGSRRQRWNGGRQRLGEAWLQEIPSSLCERKEECEFPVLLSRFLSSSKAKTKHTMGTGENKASALFCSFLKKKGQNGFGAGQRTGITPNSPYSLICNDLKREEVSLFYWGVQTFPPPFLPSLTRTWGHSPQRPQRQVARCYEKFPPSSFFFFFFFYTFFSSRGS